MKIMKMKWIMKMNKWCNNNNENNENEMIMK